MEAWMVRLRVKNAKGYGPVLARLGGVRALYATRCEAREAARRLLDESPTFTIATPVKVRVTAAPFEPSPTPRRSP